MDVDRVGAESSARDVHRLVEVVLRRGRGPIAPRHVHHLIPVQAMSGARASSLTSSRAFRRRQTRGSTETPSTATENPAQQRDADIAHRPELLACWPSHPRARQPRPARQA